MIQLPKPKRYVVSQLYHSIGGTRACFTLDADLDIFDFVRLLAPVEEVDIWPLYERKDRAWVKLNPRYGYDRDTENACYLWIVAQLEQEYGNTQPPMKAQES